jgi:hypothetical protein
MKEKKQGRGMEEGRKKRQLQREKREAETEKDRVEERQKWGEKKIG